MKKSLLLLVAMAACLSAWAQTVSTITTSENIISNSTVYVGEVVVDGATMIKYLYSGDMSRKANVINNLMNGLQGMTDAEYTGNEEHSGWFFRSVSALETDISNCSRDP